MKLLLWGAGAHGRVIHDLARACGYTDIIFADDNPTIGEVCGSTVLPTGDLHLQNYQQFIICLGDNYIRARRFEEARSRGLEPVLLIHPSAVISASSKIGAGAMVLPLVVVGGGVSIGVNCILNTGCIVEHDSKVEDHVHIGPGAVIGGDVPVGSYVTVGMKAAVLSRVKVGRGSVVGAGAVAIADVAQGWVVAGVPARPLREVAAA
jgi:sugar O-acyltransferase (sialic acid O-acetyltransferase NeuD family)